MQVLHEPLWRRIGRDEAKQTPPRVAREDHLLKYMLPLKAPISKPWKIYRLIREK